MPLVTVQLSPFFLVQQFRNKYGTAPASCHYTFYHVVIRCAVTRQRFLASLNQLSGCRALSARDPNFIGAGQNFLRCAVVSELGLLVCPLVQQAARVTFHFRHSHWVWPLARTRRRGLRRWHAPCGARRLSDGSEASRTSTPAPILAADGSNVHHLDTLRVL
jgi:hypothetical protein